MGGFNMNHIYIDIFVNKIEIYVVGYENDKRHKIKHDVILLPKSFDMGDKLYYIKKVISVIIEQYDIRAYKLNMDDDIGKEIIEAVKIEGVLEELFSCKGVELWK